MNSLQAGSVGAATTVSTPGPNSILAPPPGEAPPTAQDGNWLHDLWGKGTPKSPADLAYDAAHPVEWANALGHDTVWNVQHFAVWYTSFLTHQK